MIVKTKSVICEALSIFTFESKYSKTSIVMTSVFQYYQFIHRLAW